MLCRRIAVDARSKRGVFRRASCRARRRGALFLHRRDLKDSPSQSQSTKGDSDYRASSSARGAGETVHNGSLRLIPTVRGGPLPWPARKAAVHLLSEPVAAMPTNLRLHRHGRNALGAVLHLSDRAPDQPKRRPRRPRRPRPQSNVRSNTASNSTINRTITPSGGRKGGQPAQHAKGFGLPLYESGHQCEEYSERHQPHPNFVKAFLTLLHTAGGEYLPSPALRTSGPQGVRSETSPTLPFVMSAP
jgi:hypothetical protein